MRERSALTGLLRSCFARTQTWLQAGKYVSALASELPSANGWSVAEHAGDRTPGRSQRLLNRASWDAAAAMSQVRRYAAAGLDDAARRSRRRRMTVAALDETGQQKQGPSTSGVKRQYMGCAGRVANGINTVHLSYVREKTGHALVGARQWIPSEDIADPVKSLVTGLPLDLRFRTKGQLAIDVMGDAYGDGLAFDFACGDEVYGSCTELREFLEGRGQAYVLRVASSFMLTLAPGTKMTCADAVKKLLTGSRGWEVRSAGSGSKGERWYAWAWLGTASPRHSLLVRRHLKTGELAFHYCYVPEGQLASKARLIRAAGLRWPVDRDFSITREQQALALAALNHGHFALVSREGKCHSASSGKSRPVPGSSFMDNQQLNLTACASLLGLPVRRLQRAVRAGQFPGSGRRDRRAPVLASCGRLPVGNRSRSRNCRPDSPALLARGQRAGAVPRVS